MSHPIEPEGLRAVRLPPRLSLHAYREPKPAIQVSMPLCR